MIAVVLIVLAVLARPVGHLGCAAWRDAQADPVGTAEGPADFGRHDGMDAVHTITITDGDVGAARRALTAALRRAHDEDLPVSIAGARHSSGGQTMNDRGVYLDLGAFSCTDYDEASETIEVCSGTRWHEVVAALRPHGRAVAVMQSNADFTVGGSVSVNAHGWQTGAPPVGSTVLEMQVMRADGEVVRASAEENARLFHHVVGGYGLFGVILTARLRTVPDVTYRAVARELVASELPAAWDEVEEDGGELIYGRLSMATDVLVEQVILTSFHPSDREAPYAPNAPGELARLVFRGSAGSDYGKALRWDLERWLGGESSGLRRRTSIQNESSAWFTNRDRDRVDVLHEYFVPRDQLASFLEAVADTVRAQNADALNMTVRSVSRDVVSALPYAREDVFGVVMFFHDAFSSEGDDRQARLARALIDAAVARGGTYYLPYRLHATPEQLRGAYPDFDAFVAAKRELDPELRFRNHLWDRYVTDGVRAD